MNKGKIIKHIPNSLTMTNMLLGFASIIILMRTDLPRKELIVVVLIMIGGVLDFFDGHIARKFNAATNIGKQLDSFADLVTFGIVPVCLVNYLALCGHAIPIAVSSGAFLIAGTYRLARHNTNEFSSHFTGLPIPAAGIILGIYCIIHSSWVTYRHPDLCTLITTTFIVLLSILMVSRVKIKRVL